MTEIADDCVVLKKHKLVDGPLIQIITKKDKVSGDEFYLRLRDGDEIEDTPYEDYPQAEANWRNVLRALGIIIPWQPSVVSFHFADNAADSVFYKYHSQLVSTEVGSPAATAILNEARVDPTFRSLAREILDFADGSHWTNVVVRTLCRSIIAEEQKKAEEQTRSHFENVEGFGMF